jgi:hypothetical protein
MEKLFSYGTLQYETVQLATFVWRYGVGVCFGVEPRI